MTKEEQRRYRRGCRIVDGNDIVAMATIRLCCAGGKNNELEPWELEYAAGEIRKFRRRFRDAFEKVFNYGGYIIKREFKGNRQVSTAHVHIGFDFSPTQEQWERLEGLMRKFNKCNKHDDFFKVSNPGPEEGLKKYLKKRKKNSRNIVDLPKVLEGHDCGPIWSQHHLDTECAKQPVKKRVLRHVAEDGGEGDSLTEVALSVEGFADRVTQLRIPMGILQDSGHVTCAESLIESRQENNQCIPGSTGSVMSVSDLKNGGNEVTTEDISRHVDLSDQASFVSPVQGSPTEKRDVSLLPFSMLTDAEKEARGEEIQRWYFCQKRSMHSEAGSSDSNGLSNQELNLMLGNEIWPI